MSIRDDFDIKGDLIKEKVKTEIENEFQVAGFDNNFETKTQDDFLVEIETEKELLENEIKTILETCPEGVVVDEQLLEEDLNSMNNYSMNKEQITMNNDCEIESDVVVESVETEIESRDSISPYFAENSELRPQTFEPIASIPTSQIIETQMSAPHSQDIEPQMSIPQSQTIEPQMSTPQTPPPPQFSQSIGRTTSKECNVFKKASWIWAEDNSRREDFVMFRRKFTLEKKPKEAKVSIGVCGFYHMYVNNKLIVYDGALTPSVGSNYGYFDTIDIAPYLAKGENVIGMICVKTESFFTSGMILECSELDIYSNASFTVYRTNAHKIEGDKLTYDATLEGQIDHVFEAAYGASIFVPAKEYGAYGSGYYFDLEPRKIPLFKVSNPIKGKRIAKEVDKNEVTYTYCLDGYYHAVPIISCNASSGQAVVEIKTDRYRSYDIRGGVHTNRTLDYICKDGNQTYESVMPLVGTKLIVKAPLSVKISSIQFRTTEFDLKHDEQEDIVGEISKIGKEVEVLSEKAVETLIANMRSIYSRTPERASKNVLGDFSAAAQLASYALSDTSLSLTKKCIEDMLISKLLKEGKSLIMSLIAISNRGAISAYFGKTNDVQTLKKCLPQMLDLINSVQVDEKGIAQLPNDHKETDYFYNVDELVLLNSVFYSAINFYLAAQFSCGERENGEIARKRDMLKNNFELTFFKGRGYSSTENYDERANAWAVISGLASFEHRTCLITLLSSVQTASPTFENYVIDALMTVGAKQKAVKRLLGRFHAMIDNEEKCLNEDFFSGSICYANSAGVATNFYRHIAGVEFREGKVFITPDFSFDGIEFTVAVPSGTLKGHYNKGEVMIVLKSSCEAYVLIPEKGSIMKQVKLNKGKNKIQL
ncbi:MAG: hypothetical protein FWC11_04755 [Firmicutes bacterium]|nr:hypothetical protein [Bacillota bacterium]MCL2256152.1 hypothetical protein [Bacillota bacterium]